MFERFTGDARQVVVQAQEQARDLQHNYIGTEHLLLGVLAVPGGVAARTLRQLGLGRDTVVADIQTMVGRGDAEPSGHIPFTPRAKKVLELALREALQLKVNYIGTEHILLALVREGDGVAAQIMASRLHDIEAVRKTVMAQLRERGPEAPGDAAPTGRRTKATSAAEEVIASAEALAGGAPLGSHHLLEALVRADGSLAAKVLESLGVQPEAVAAKVDELDPEDTTDATPEEAAARKMELRVEGGEVHLVFRDEGTVDLATKVTELAGGPVLGTGPVSGAFVPLWASTNELMHTFLRSLQPEPEGEVKDVLAKASLLMRRVMRGRLQRRQRNDPEQA